jgi:hypothetical protein
MTQNYFPFDVGAGAGVQESQWREMARYFRGTGVLSGFANTLEVYADSSGMQVKVKTGEAWIDGFKYKNDLELIVPISMANPTYGRIDRVVLRLDPSANTLQVAVLTGTPSGSPAVPALTQSLTGTYEISLAKITVDAGAVTIAAGKVTDERTYSYATVSPPLAAEYDSGWFAVISITVYTLTHGLGGAPKSFLILWCSTATPTPTTKIYSVQVVRGSGGATLSIGTMTGTTILASTGNDVSRGTLSACDGTTSSAGYYRVLAWK